MCNEKIFIGRKKELELLESLYNSNKFEMLLLHGRRRVGKSYLLSYFARLHQKNVVYFTGDKSSEKTNVQNFCEELNKNINAGVL
jgi:AAA+ ATPase superfamily predicted ATPase